MQTSIWLIPSFVTLLLYGLGQGLVKKWSTDVSPARFCLFLILARAVVNLGFFLTQEHPTPFAGEDMAFMLIGILAYVLDGLGWILYFGSIVYGPITIVGTLSAAYPALTLLFARIFLNEQLLSLQYFGVFMVIFGCLGLSYSPSDPNDPDAKATNRRWIPMALMALVCWGAAQTLLRYSYGLPGANEANMALYATVGGILTLGVYGLLKGLKASSPAEAKTPFFYSFLPMAMMAGGDLGVIIASSTGPASLVAPITGAYPVVTLVFAAFLLNEQISKLQWTALMILLLGIAFTTIPQGPEAEAEASAVESPTDPVPVAPDPAGLIPSPAPS